MMKLILELSKRVHHQMVQLGGGGGGLRWDLLIHSRKWRCWRGCFTFDAMFTDQVRWWRLWFPPQQNWCRCPPPQPCCWWGKDRSWACSSPRWRWLGLALVDAPGHQLLHLLCFMVHVAIIWGATSANVRGRRVVFLQHWDKRSSLDSSWYFGSG